MVLAVLGVAGLLFAYRLGAGSLWDVDEPRYAEAAREILATGDPLTMHLDGERWYGPPPLWMWVEAALGGAFGFSELVARSGAAAFGVLGVGATCLLGREWFGARTGVLAGLVLATMLEYVLLSRLGIPDTAGVALVLLALWAFSRAYRSGWRAGYLVSFGLAGLAVLARGPAALAFLGAVVLGFLGYRGRLGRAGGIPWPAGLALCLGIASPWYVAEALRGGPAFLEAALGDANPARFVHGAGPRVLSLLYHVPVFLLGTVPWTAFLPASAAYHYDHRWQDGSLLVLLGSGVSLLAAVLSGTRRPDEVALAFPFAALAVARLWEEFLYEGTSRLHRVLRTAFVLQAGAVAALALVAVAFATVRYPREFLAVRGSLLAPLAVLLAGPAATALLFRGGKYTAAFLALPAATAAFVGVLATVTLPAVEAQKPTKPVAASLGEWLRPEDRLIAYRLGSGPSLLYYARHPVEAVEDPRVLRQRLCAPGRAVVVSERAELVAARAWLPPGMREVGGRGDLVVLLKPPRLPCGGEV